MAKLYKISLTQKITTLLNWRVRPFVCSWICQDKTKQTTLTTTSVLRHLILLCVVAFTTTIAPSYANTARCKTVPRDANSQDNSFSGL